MKLPKRSILDYDETVGRFPWRLFSFFFFVLLVSFGSLALLLPHSFALLSGPDGIHWGWYAVVAISTHLVVAGLIALRFTRPMHRLIQKAYRISSKRQSQTQRFYKNEEDDLARESGEYQELEEALDRIQKKMAKRKEQLTREREEAQVFLSAVREAILRVDADQSIVSFNSLFGTLFLESKLLHSENLKLSDIFRMPEVYEPFHRAIFEAQEQRVTIKIHTRLDNQPRQYVLSINPIGQKVEGRKGVPVVGLFADITDIKLAEQIRIDFVANASHELRTPLTSVKGYLETLNADIKSGQLASTGKFLDIIMRNVDRLINIVNDLLSLSQLESTGDLQLTELSPLALTDQIVSDLKIMTCEKNHTIRFESQVDRFTGDAEKVEQVLRNLIVNAIKYIPDNGLIWVRWEADDRQVILRVTDNGPGIPPEHHSRLFERFYRVDKGRTREAGGTGLGLAIVKHIMQKHGGTIQIKSQAGQGAEFVCAFPQVPRSQIQTPLPAPLN